MKKHKTPAIESIGFIHRCLHSELHLFRMIAIKIIGAGKISYYWP